MKLKVKKLSERAKLPTYGSEGAACFDIKATKDYIIYPGEITRISTGLSFEIPKGHCMLLFGRSGHASKGLQLANCVGVIDSDYRGEVQVMLHNLDIDTRRIVEGERCAQAMILPVMNVEFEEVQELEETERGEGGFGSTGLL